MNAPSELHPYDIGALDGLSKITVTLIGLRFARGTAETRRYTRQTLPICDHNPIATWTSIEQHSTLWLQ